MEDKVKTNTVTEGKANIIHPASVFYNPVQQFNRDLTIAILSQFAKEQISEKREKAKKSGAVVNDVVTEENLVAGQKYDSGLRILEGLAASGLRSMRFGLEIPGVKEVIANDFDKNAVEIIKENITRNNLQHLVTESHADVGLLMFQSKCDVETRFDVIDLDPYGSPAKFLDPCVQAVRGGGMLCITCTDAAVLCGNFPEKCYQSYGGLPVRGAFCHEMALRIILQSLQSHAARYQKYIVPILSLSIDFYFRLFVKVHYKPSIAKYSASNTGLVFNCSGCGSYTIQPLATVNQADKKEPSFSCAKGPIVKETCENCGYSHRIAGPIYIKALHDKVFVNDVLKYVREHPERFETSKRIEGMLSMAVEEDDLPLYYEIDELCKTLHCMPIKMMKVRYISLFNPLYYEIDELCKTLHCMPIKMMKVRSAILNAGYQVSFSHACKNSIKTNAPNSLLWDILRVWIKDNPISAKRQEPGSVVQQILSQEPTHDVNFDPHPDANPSSRALNLVRHQPNPMKNWGPKPRARKNQDGDDLEERRARNQGKRKKKDVNTEHKNDNGNMETPE